MNDSSKVIIGLYFLAWSCGRKASEVRMQVYRKASQVYLKASVVSIKAMNSELDRWSVK